MTQRENLDLVKNIPILEVAERLGIYVVRNKARCFNGHDKTPSLNFRISHNTWKCFGACGKGGDVIALVMEAGRLDFKQALEWFAENFSVDVRIRPSNHKTYFSKTKHAKKSLPKKILAESPKFQKDPEVYKSIMDLCSAPATAKSIQYLESHAISEEAARKFGIKEIKDGANLLGEVVSIWGRDRVYQCGIVAENSNGSMRFIWNRPALLFPFCEGDYITYIQARMLIGEPKFLNLRGVIKPLFNFNRLSNVAKNKPLHICEGVPDAIALETAGLAAIAVLGAQSFNQDWVDVLKGFNIVVLGDGDKAGAQFASSVAQKFLERGKVVTKMKMPEGLDVSDVLARSRGNQ